MEIVEVTQDKKALLMIKNGKILNVPIPPDIIAQLTNK
jgi:hypothetical protein